MCVAWVATAEEEIGHNLSVIADIKKIVDTRPDAELKYSIIRRHRRKADALAALGKARIGLLIAPIFKASIHDPVLRDPGTKRLVRLIHEFPANNLFRYIAPEGVDFYLQLVHDRIGWRGCQEAIIERYRQAMDWSDARPDWLRFGDWTDTPMLQMADVLAGLANEYVQSIDTNDLIPCWLCRKNADAGRRWQQPRGCKGSTGIGNWPLLQVLTPLLMKDARGLILEAGFLPRPPQWVLRFAYLDCPVTRAKKNAVVRAG